VIEAVRSRLGAERVIVLGISGGSMVGLMLAKARPDLIAAYVGTAQFVDWGRQLGLGYARALVAAKARGDREAAAALERIGPPPYADVAADLVASMHLGAQTRAEAAEFEGLDAATAAAMATPPQGATYVLADLELPDQRARSLAAYIALRPELIAFDARRLGPAFEAPMIFLQGDADIYSETSEVEAYAAEIDAPAKAFALIEGGGHSAVFLREPFLAALKQALGRTGSR
jgi:pimeloyl-ACP methyl ester carboxylesterase